MIHTLKNTKKKYLILGVVILLVVLLLVFKNNNDNSEITYTVVKQDVADTITLAGTIDVENRVDLGFAASGRISQVFFEKGEKVNKGQVIAQIDQNQLQASLIQARAGQVVTEADTESDSLSVNTDLVTLEAQQDELVEGAYKTYLSGDLQAYLDSNSSRELVAPIVSGTYLGKQEGVYSLDVYSSGTSSGYSFRLSGLSSGTYEARNFQPGKLGDEGLYIQFDKDTNYGNTTWVVPVPNTRSSTYLSRKTTYDNAVATRDKLVSQAQNSVDRVEASALDISRTQAQIQQARAQVSAIYAQLNDGKIIAPFDGVIARNDLEIGQIITAFDPVVTLFGGDDRELGLNVPEIYINKLQEGDIVDVVLDAYPNEKFTGTVKSIDIIDTLVDGVPVYETTVIVNENDQRIRVGMNAKGKITSEEKKLVIAVPHHYVTEEDESFFVTKKVSSELQKTKVELGFKGNDGLVEITSGLKEGDVIIRPSGFSDKDN